MFRASDLIDWGYLAPAIYGEENLVLNPVPPKKPTIQDFLTWAEQCYASDDEINLLVIEDMWDTFMSDWASAAQHKGGGPKPRG